MAISFAERAPEVLAEFARRRQLFLRFTQSIAPAASSVRHQQNQPRYASGKAVVTGPPTMPINYSDNDILASPLKVVDHAGYRRRIMICSRIFTD